MKEFLDTALFVLAAIVVMAFALLFGTLIGLTGEVAW